MIFPKSVYDNKYIERRYAITGRIDGQVVHLTVHASNVMDAIRMVTTQNPGFEVANVQVTK